MRMLALGALALLASACGPNDNPEIAGSKDVVPIPTVYEQTRHPACTGTLLQKSRYLACHDDDWLIARWTAHRITAEDINGTADRTDDYRPDPDLPIGHRAELEDYRSSGFDRGHLAPAGDFKSSEEAMSESFILSNIAPQTAALNRGPWVDLENSVRFLAQSGETVWIYTGNLMLDSSGRQSVPDITIGPHAVAVPSHCFKVLLSQRADGLVRVFAYVMPNDEEIFGEWYDFQYTVDDVEAMSGLDFFADLPDAAEEDLEQTLLTFSYW